MDYFGVLFDLSNLLVRLIDGLPCYTDSHFFAMLVANHILTIISLLPLSLSVILEPALATHLVAHTIQSPITVEQLDDHDRIRWLPKKRFMRHGRRRVPQVRAGGVELDVHKRGRRKDGLERRAGGNGSITNLATALE